ncbi:Transmembrane protein [Balamuthia mandrillaris]
MNHGELNAVGLAAVALELLGYSTDQSFSVISLGNAIPSHSAEPNSFGIRWIQLTLWLLPLRPIFQRLLFLVSEVLNAWSSLEVFIVSIVAALLQIDQFAEFIVGDKCEAIDDIVEQYLKNFLHGEPATCFSVVATLQWGCWLLFIACLVYQLAAFLVMRLCHKIMEEREHQAFRASLNSHTAASSSSSSGSASPSSWPLSSLQGGNEEETLQQTKAILDEMKDSRCGPAIRYVCLLLRLVREEEKEVD